MLRHCLALAAELSLCLAFAAWAGAGSAASMSLQFDGPRASPAGQLHDAPSQLSLVCTGGVRRRLNLCPWSGERLAGSHRLHHSQTAIIHLSDFDLPVLGLRPARGATRKELRHEAAQLAEGIPPPRATGPPGPPEWWPPWVGMQWTT